MTYKVKPMTNREADIIDGIADCISDQCKNARIPKYKLAYLLDRRKSYISEITGKHARYRYVPTLPLWLVRDMAAILDSRGADGTLLLRHMYTYLSLKEKEAA